MIPRREEGVTHVIEFTFALTLFLIIIQAFSTTMDFRIGVDLDSNDNRIAAARSITHELAGSSGNASGTVDWETLEWGSGSPQLSAGLTVGLLTETGVLSLAKCEALAKFTYNGLRDELGTKDGLSVEVRTLSPDARVSFWGGDVSKATVSVTEERILLLRTADGDVPAKLRVTLFSGVTPDTTLRLTEVMYQPASGTEWVEIYNPAYVAAEVAGWKLSDLAEEDLILGGDGETLTIPARSAAIVAASPATFASSYPSVSYVFGLEDSAIGDGLGDIADTIALGYHSYSDALAYEDDDGANGDGNSLTRDCPTCDGWTAATATPGTV